MVTQLAEKSDDMSDQEPSNEKVAASRSGGAKAPPAASLTALSVRRGHAEQREDAAEFDAPPATPEPAPEPEPVSEPAPELAPEPEGAPVDARAQQAILEDAFVEPVAVAAPPIERAELQSARDAAAKWRLRRSPSVGFWERVIKDASIFTIFFAVLVFAILQTM